MAVESATGRPPAQTLPAPAVDRADQARRQGGHVPQSGQLGQGHQACVLDDHWHHDLGRSLISDLPKFEQDQQGLAKSSSLGPSIYDVRKIFGFFAPPLSPFVRILCTVCSQIYGIF